MPVPTPATDRFRLGLAVTCAVAVILVVAVPPATSTFLLHLPYPVSATCAIVGLAAVWSTTHATPRRGPVRAVVVIMAAVTVVANVAVLHHWTGGADLVLQGELMMGDPEVDLTGLSEQIVHNNLAVDRAVVVATYAWSIMAAVVLAVLATPSVRRLRAHRAPAGS